MYLGVDWGSKMIGLAVGSEIPYELATIRNDKGAIEKIAQLCVQEKIERIVIGMPVLESGDKGNLADKVEYFGRQLKEKTNLPIYFEPENLTTQTALELLKEEGMRPDDIEKKVDQTAARLILEQYIANIEEDISQEAL
ncbi:MAG: Holliday junction resolvase RuvX [Patescibacteria group bacterium]|jgi:putative Holliday junction resolvase|nr:Holliday junction resolvase RuvX [Patescibacteria group bacterium]HPL01534.1 Holliday junction resolvase RuvX [bacterium]